MDRAVPSGTIELTHDGHDGIFGLLHNSKYARANHFGSIDFIADERNLWESFRLLDLDDLRRLKFVLSNEWVVNGEQELVTFDPIESGIAKIAFGKRTIGFDQFMCEIGKDETAKEFIFFDGWKANKAKLYKPVLVFVLFGYGSAVKQFESCVEGLKQLSCYHGEIIIVGDVDEILVRNMLGEPLSLKTRVVRYYGGDQLDYVGARLSIFNSEILDSYQPILYSDVDIIFDCNINPFLMRSACAEKCSAQVEPFHLISESEHAGATLVRQDPFPGMEKPGFNGGLLMVPNVENHGKYLRAAFRSMSLYCNEQGRKSIPFYDQSVLNYVLYKMGDFDASPVTECVQIGGPDFPADPSNPRGFVHFWNARYKPGEMLDYVGSVIAESQGRVVGADS